MQIRLCKCGHPKRSHINMAIEGPCQECPPFDPGGCDKYDDSGEYMDTTEPKEEPT